MKSESRFRRYRITTNLLQPVVNMDLGSRRQGITIVIGVKIHQRLNHKSCRLTIYYSKLDSQDIALILIGGKIQLARYCRLQITANLIAIGCKKTLKLITESLIFYSYCKKYNSGILSILVVVDAVNGLTAALPM